MNKNKKLILGLSISIPLLIIILVVVLYFSILASYRNLPPLSDKTYSYDTIELRSNMNELDKYDNAKLVITQITKDEYNSNALINVFYDYVYDVYYKVEVTLKKDSNLYNAKVFCVHSRNITYFYHQRYSFDIEIDGKIYQNALFIHNYGLIKPSIDLGG